MILHVFLFYQNEFNFIVCARASVHTTDTLFEGEQFDCANTYNWTASEVRKQSAKGIILLQFFSNFSVNIRNICVSFLLIMYSRFFQLWDSLKSEQDGFFRILHDTPSSYRILDSSPLTINWVWGRFLTLGTRFTSGIQITSERKILPLEAFYIAIFNKQLIY